MILSSDNIFAVDAYLCRFNGEKGHWRYTRAICTYSPEGSKVQTRGIALISFRSGPTDSQRTAAQLAPKEYNENIISPLSAAARPLAKTERLTILAVDAAQRTYDFSPS